MPEYPLQPVSYDLLAARLHDAREALTVLPALAVGSIVRWKRGLQQSDWMDVNGFAVVVALHATPFVADDVAPLRSEYRLPLDVELGTLDAEGLFFVFWTCQAFLEPDEAARSQVAGKLRTAYAAFRDDGPLQLGQPVVWKPHCAVPGVPHPEEPALLVQLLDGEPVVAQGASCERGFRQPIDAAVAIEEDTCGFRIVWTDRRRLTPYAGPVSAEAVCPTEVGADAESEADKAAAVAIRLAERYARWCGPLVLQPGMLASWKYGLRDRTIPLDGDAAIVMAVRNPPLCDPLAVVGGPTWRQPLSVALGCMGEDGHFVVCHYDGGRFEPLPSATSEHRAFLEHAYALYGRAHRFGPGDLVQWKAGLVNRRSPSEGSVAVVMEALDSARFSGHIEGTSPYFQEPLTLVIGVREDDVLEVLHVDGARFQPAAADASPEEAAWLRERFVQFATPSMFALGGIVEWKDGLCSTPGLDPEGHGVVVGTLDPPVVPSAQSAGSPFFGIPHTLVVGFVDAEDDFRLRCVDGRRLRPATPDPEQDERLGELYGEFTAPHDFAAGQIVTWTPGLRGEAFIELSVESPGIVLRRLDPPVLSPQENVLAGDYGARADLLVGGFDADGDFAVMHADSRRLQSHASQRGDAARRLRGFRRRLRQHGALHPGLLVAWKDRFSTQTALPNGVPGIVLEAHDKLVNARNEAAGIDSPAFVLPWNTVVGVWTDTRLLRIHCDGRRLEPFDAELHGEILRRRATEEARRFDEFSRMLEEFDEEDPPF